jgi:hypothetical protein
MKKDYSGLKRQIYSMLFFLTLFLLNISSCTNFIHKDFYKIQSTIHTIAIVSPQIEFYEKVGEEFYLKPENNSIVSNNIAQVIKNVVNEKSIFNNATLIPVNTILVEVELRKNSIKPTKTLKAILDSLKTNINNGNTSIPQLNFFDEKVNVDCIMLIRGKAYRVVDMSTYKDIANKQAFQLLYDNPLYYEYQWVGLELEIALVDPKTTEVIWFNYNKVSKSKYDPFNNESIKDLKILAQN